VSYKAKAAQGGYFRELLSSNEEIHSYSTLLKLSRDAIDTLQKTEYAL